LQLLRGLIIGLFARRWPNRCLYFTATSAHPLTALWSNSHRDDGIWQGHARASWSRCLGYLQL